ncbi:hypothetical protein TPAR_08892 [Tolypocladium paradoxum]|uniref:Uncharacterized protein n=1 Tax=Tolypocladium paradoxum TaxID=94208 RepID=A0A2S4KLA6_9HYPO|nr:hypothetical protein TPAR_08892 [Tolypocladium paradoxum]
MEAVEAIAAHSACLGRVARLARGNRTGGGGGGAVAPQTQMHETPNWTKHQQPRGESPLIRLQRFLRAAVTGASRDRGAPADQMPDAPPQPMCQHARFTRINLAFARLLLEKGCSVIHRRPQARARGRGPARRVSAPTGERRRRGQDLSVLPQGGRGPVAAAVAALEAGVGGVPHGGRGGARRRAVRPPTLVELLGGAAHAGRTRTRRRGTRRTRSRATTRCSRQGYGSKTRAEWRRCSSTPDGSPSRTSCGPCASSSSTRRGVRQPGGDAGGDGPDAHVQRAVSMPVMGAFHEKLFEDLKTKGLRV